jgi:hypothetical protein
LRVAEAGARNAGAQMPLSGSIPGDPLKNLADQISGKNVVPVRDGERKHGRRRSLLKPEK